jgi:hypothetical protein
MLNKSNIKALKSILRVYMFSGAKPYKIKLKLMDKLRNGFIC